MSNALFAVIVGAGMIVALICAVALLVPQYPVKVKAPACSTKLERLVALWRLHRDDPASRARSGQALLLGWRKDGSILAPYEEGVLICPGDNSISVPDTPEALARYDTVDLSAPPSDLCSYCVRDFARFPVDPEKEDEEPVFACLGTGSGASWCAHHRDTFIVAFADGDVEVLHRADLGLAPGVPVVIGPDSPTPLLRVFLPK